MVEFLNKLSQYRSLFLVLFEILLIIVCVIIVKHLLSKMKEESKKQEKVDVRTLIRSDYKGNTNEVDRQNAIRQILAPDGVNPCYNAYMGISDGGKEVMVRTVTISKLPKKVRFASTLKPLLDFPDCTCTCFVEPIDGNEMGRKLDKQINILGAEEIVEQGNANRLRKLGHQVNETTKWATEVEAGDKKFFYAGFLFTFSADTVEELDKKTDQFRMLALNKKMDISNCYGVQSEAFLSNLPLNRKHRARFGFIQSDAVKMFLMDQESISVILNYTTDYFTHKNGIPLGRNMFNGMPFVFDLYEPSHDGYTLIIAGKTNSGKSATIKMIMERTIPHGYRYVVIDSQTRKGTSEGEYASVTELNDGINFQISSKNSNILNIFHVQESKEFIKQGADSGYEVRTLDLNGAITEMVYNLRSMMQIGATDQDKALDAVMDSDIDRILTKVVKDMFVERGIIHGDADSLYEEGDVISGAMLQAGYVPKELPTVTECYKKILKEKWATYDKWSKDAETRDSNVEGAFKLILNNLAEYVRELYYAEDSRRFFSAAEYERMDINPSKKGERVFENEDGDLEEIISVKGIRPYFDGQSTLFATKECPVVNVDISQLTEMERKVAREIAVRFINEQFIKKNSENLDGADKLVVIVDEAHENFEYEYGRKTFANAVRTARKRNSGMIFSTQTVKEFSRHPETEDILKQAAAKFVFKQDGQDREHLVKALNITESQANIITNMLGVVTDKSDPNARTKHRGEMCVIDGEQVLFVKVDYLKRTEALAVETDASSVIRKINRA